MTVRIVYTVYIVILYVCVLTISNRGLGNLSGHAGFLIVIPILELSYRMNNSGWENTTDINQLDVINTET